MGIDLYSPDTYVDGPPHATFAELRRTDPVHWQDVPGEPGYWAVLRHADVVTVARNAGIFSAEEGGVMLENLAPEQLEMMRHMLLAMDPPRHDEHRRPLAPTFAAKIIGAMEAQVRAIVGGILDDAAVRGDVDFVHDVSAPVPSQVVGELMGLPEADRPQIHVWAERMTSTQDADIAGDGPVNAASFEMAMYAIELAGRRRAEPPREDLTSLILAGDFGHGPMTDVDFGAFFVQLVTAGNDTTKTMLSSGVHALVEDPEQLAALRADLSRAPGAIEEILRFANPLHYFRRTATRDTELNGTKIAAGDKVAMIYTSANRDRDVFRNADSFDIARDPNPHLSFGIGTHFCLGAHLARLEGRVFLEELLTRFAALEQTGAAVRVRSNLNNGLKRLPMRLVPA